MRICDATLESVSPYSQSRHYETEKNSSELDRDFETRTWRDRVHATDDGTIFITPMCFKNALSEAAKYISMQIPGKGKATYTKHFEAGLLVTEPLMLPIKKADVDGEWLYVPSDGRRGGPKRVWKCFPLIKAWTGAVRFHILDDMITPEVFERHLAQAGSFIGIGRFRPRNNGFYGRFRIVSMKWE
jgi:hypothetical protein